MPSDTLKTISATPAAPVQPKIQVAPSPTLLGLPTELLISIVQRLTTPDLAWFARTCRMGYLVSTPILYESLYIDLAEDINPLFTRSTKDGSVRRLSSPKLDAALSKIKLGSDNVVVHDQPKEGKKDYFGWIKDYQKGSSTSSSASAAAPRQSLGPLPHRFSFTTTLSITSHKTDICRSHSLLLMPRLHTLRIKAGWQDNHLDFCQCVHFNDKTGRCTRRPACVCPLVGALRPRRLMIGGDTAGLTGSEMGMTPLAEAAWVKEVVIFVGPCSGIEIGPQKKHNWLPDVPASVERLSLVMQPQEGWRTTDGRWRFRRVAGWEGRIDPSFLWDKMGVVLSGNAKAIEVVGIEVIDRDWSELPIKLEEEEVRKALKVALVGKGRSEAEAKARVKDLTFIGKKAWATRTAGELKKGKGKS